MALDRGVGVIVTSILALVGLIVLISRASTKNLFLAEIFFWSLFVIAAIIVWILVFRNESLSWLLSTFYFSLLLFFILFAYFNATKGILVMTSSVVLGFLGLVTSIIAINEAKDEEKIEEIAEEMPETWYESSANTGREFDYRKDIGH